MSVLKKDAEGFEASVKRNFSFLESELGFRYAGLKIVDEDPRDSYVVAKYRREELRIDIAWNPYSKSLGVLIRLDNAELKRRERHVYFEPFIEFSSGGDIAPIVPQIYPGMGVGQIEKTIERRDELFSRGVGKSINALAERLKIHLSSVVDAAVDMIREYQAWYQSRGKAA